MKTNQSLLSAEETETLYELVEDYFGTLKVDTVYYEIAHQY